MNGWVWFLLIYNGLNILVAPLMVNKKAEWSGGKATASGIIHVWLIYCVLKAVQVI